MDNIASQLTHFTVVEAGWEEAGDWLSLEGVWRDGKGSGETAKAFSLS